MHDYSHKAHPSLRECRVNERPRLLVERAVFAVLRDAYNLSHRARAFWIATQPQSLPEGALIGPILLRQSLVDDRHPWRARLVGSGKIAAREPRDSHYVEISRCDQAGKGPPRLLRAV